jgi:DNA-binding XRE family transcriptional regulator
MGAEVKPDELIDLQARASMTNADLAEALGVSRSTVVKWRGGQHPIPNPVAIAVRALLRGAA